jgi:hypothetical protein
METTTLATVTKRIAKSGSRTADGREMPKAKLAAVAASYDPATYAARVNLEHFIADYPDSTFREYGTVLALRTEPADKNEIYLIADIDAHDDLIKMWDAGQKRAFSVELLNEFADTGKPYLYGLAVTSYPASLGTHFSTSPSTRPESERYQFLETERRVDDHADYAVEPFAMTDKTNETQTTPETPATTPAATTEQPVIPEQFSQHLQHFSTEIGTLRTERDQLKADLAAQKETFATQLAAKDTAIAAKDTEILELKKQIPADGYQFRALTTGGEDQQNRTDC